MRRNRREHSDVTSRCEESHREDEIRRQDADYPSSTGIEWRDGADDVRPSSEVEPPGGVGEHDDRFRSRFAVPVLKIPSESRVDSKYRQEIRADRSVSNSSRLIAGKQQLVDTEVVQPDVLECA
jgi:hypothetical protein